MIRPLAVLATLLLVGQSGFAQSIDASVVKRAVKWSIEDDPGFDGPNKVFLASSLLRPTSQESEIGDLLITTKQDGHNDDEMRGLHIDLKTTLPEKSIRSWNANLVGAMILAATEARTLYNPTGLITIDETMPMSCDIDVVAIHSSGSSSGVPIECRFSVQVSSKAWKSTSAQHANRLYTSTQELIRDYANSSKRSPWVNVR